MARSPRVPPPPGSPRHGKRCTYTAYHCRCPLCTEANRIGCEQAKRKREQRSLAPDDPRHGDPSTYTNWGCRCQPCTTAQTERCRPYQKVYQQRHREELTEKRRQARADRGQLAADDPRHGTSAGYHYWQCRCDACRAFASAENRAVHERRKLNGRQRKEGTGR